MKLLPVTTNYFYEFTCEESLLNEVINDVKSIKYKNNGSNFISNTDYYHKNLFKWFKTCLNEIKQDLAFNSGIDLVITTCWVNRANKLEKHDRHGHPNCFCSAVFYLTSHESSFTNFYFKNDWLVNRQIVPFNAKTFPEINFQVKPEAGKLVVFPGNTIHDVSPLKPNENTRYSVSFNAFYNGVINDGYTESLEIKVNSLEDKILEGKVL